jgi:hypothetical protein
LAIFVKAKEQIIRKILSLFPSAVVSISPTFYEQLLRQYSCAKKVKTLNLSTGRPRYMQEIGTVKYVSHIMNFHIKRPRMTIK